jgi:hypothetical protein
MIGFGQARFSSDPDSSVFLTKDIDNFWTAFDAFQKDSTANPFGEKYIDVGSSGVKGFTPYRIQNAAHLFATVNNAAPTMPPCGQTPCASKKKKSNAAAPFML